MVAFGLFHASLVFVGLLAPAALGAPTANKTVITPFGEHPVANVHTVPEGKFHST